MKQKIYPNLINSSSRGLVVKAIDGPKLDSIVAYSLMAAGVRQSIRQNVVMLRKKLHMSMPEP